MLAWGWSNNLVSVHGGILKPSAAGHECEHHCGRDSRVRISCEYLGNKSRLFSCLIHSFIVVLPFCLGKWPFAMFRQSLLTQPDGLEQVDPRGKASYLGCEVGPKSQDDVRTSRHSSCGQAKPAFQTTHAKQRLGPRQSRQSIRCSRERCHTRKKERKRSGQ